MYSIEKTFDFIKGHFFPIALLIVASGTMSFQAANEHQDELYWFHFDGTTVGSYIDEDIDEVCPLPQGTIECAYGYEEEYVDTEADPIVLKTETEPLNHWEEERFQEED